MRISDWSSDVCSSDLLKDLSKTSEVEERDTDSMDLHTHHGLLTSEPIDIPRFFSDVTMLRSSDALKAKADDAVAASQTTVASASPRSWKPLFPFLQRNRSLSFAGTPSAADVRTVDAPNKPQE